MNRWPLVPLSPLRYLCVAVTPSAHVGAPALQASLIDAGYRVWPQPPIMRGPAGSVVLHAMRAPSPPGATVRPTPSASLDVPNAWAVGVAVVLMGAMLISVKTKSTTATAVLRRREFQPVVSVLTLDRTGLEIAVRDDDDATAQLDLLARALEVPREALEIKPRAGWSRYGAGPDGGGAV
jgi:hypothetical protein